MTLKTHSEEVLLEQKSKHLLLLEKNADIMSLAMFHTEMADSLRASLRTVSRCLCVNSGSQSLKCSP